MLLNVLAVFLDVIEIHNLESLFIHDGGVNRFLLSEVNFTGFFAIINHWVFPICKIPQLHMDCNVNKSGKNNA